MGDFGGLVGGKLPYVSSVVFVGRCFGVIFGFFADFRQWIAQQLEGAICPEGFHAIRVLVNGGGGWGLKSRMCLYFHSLSG